MSSTESKSSPLYVVLCANGQVGSAITNRLLQQVKSNGRIRAVV